jgi:hypothetical protein
MNAAIQTVLTIAVATVFLVRPGVAIYHARVDGRIAARHARMEPWR